MTAKHLFRILFWITTLFGVLVLILDASTLSFGMRTSCIGLLYCVTLGILWFISRKIEKPLEQLNKHLTGISKNDLDQHITVPHRYYNELFSATRDIQEILRHYSVQVYKNKEDFHAVLGSIHEALWIQDAKGIILSANAAFSSITNTAHTRDMYFWNVIRQKELYDFVDSIFKAPRDRIRELTFDDRHYICSASYTAITQETIFILYDISEIRRMEIMKKDFVRNVSHELRTPLTSIKGYVETMADEAGDEFKAYLDVVKRNTDRLIHIVNDLLSLSQLEHESSIQRENVDVREFMHSIEHVFAQRLLAKNLHLNTVISPDITQMRVDRFKLEQVFFNLIDNAVKYTERGEITITFSRGKVLTRISISDTGQGIEPQHLNRLFERFYVVDKSRSRKLGGTGLGLSIVKHIVALHRGTIDVKSTPGSGTTFTITLPDVV